MKSTYCEEAKMTKCGVLKRCFADSMRYSFAFVILNTPRSTCYMTIWKNVNRSFRAIKRRLTIYGLCLLALHIFITSTETDVANKY